MTHLSADPALTTAIVVVKTGILVLGGLISYFSYKAYRNTGARALRSLAVGFAIVTVGSLVAGAFDVLFHVPLPVGVLIDSSLTLVGFAVITYSLFAD